MINPGAEHCKALGRLVGCLKGKETKGITTIKPKFMKLVMFCNSSYTTDKETRNSVSGLVATLVGILLTFLSKTHSTVVISITEVEYVASSAFAQEVNFVSMFQVEMS